MAFPRYNRWRRASRSVMTRIPRSGAEAPDLRCGEVSDVLSAEDVGPPSTAVHRTGSSAGSDRITALSITGSTKSAASARFSAKRAASAVVIRYRACILG